MIIPSIEKDYQELKTELKICKIGGLFIALYRQKEVPQLIMQSLRNDHDLDGFLHFPLDIDEKKVAFPILFEQTFEQTGNKSNIYHVLGIEDNLSEKAAQEFLGYLQYARERLKAKPYSLVFWITPEFEKTLFFEAPDFHHWVFGAYDFSNITDDEIQRIKSSGNQELCDLYKIDEYLKNVIWQYENWQTVKENNESFLLEPMERNDLYTYYVQSYCIDKQGKEKLLDDLLNKFIQDDKQTFLTLLGDFGTGKSSFSIYYFIELAKKYLSDKTQRIPIFISLKDYKGKFKIEEFMIKDFYNKFNIKINFAIFQNLALEGKFIFFIDGFDEMASLNDHSIPLQNFKELTKLSFENILFLIQSQHKPYQLNKVFLTSRTHYFLDEEQEQNILKADYTILYRNYATKTNYEISRIKLKEFNNNQIRKYVQKHTENQKVTNHYLQIIDNTYNLKDLSTRPLLLEMIIKTIPILKAKKTINPADLYQAYTNIWIERDDWRSQMTSEGKRIFMWEIAYKMFKRGGNFSLHYSQIDKPNNQYLKPDFSMDNDDYYKYEATTCSFLNRDSYGNYKFIHKSFMEYFIAEYFLDCLRGKNDKLFHYPLLNNEIKFFLKYIISLNKNKLQNLDLSPFDLSQTDLSNANLMKAKLIINNLQEADLTEANLTQANLKGVNFIRAKLNGANLKEADLSKAYFSETDLMGANLDNANLQDANFTYTKNITVKQIKKAKNWQFAIYNPEFREKLG